MGHLLRIRCIGTGQRHEPRPPSLAPLPQSLRAPAAERIPEARVNPPRPPRPDGPCSAQLRIEGWGVGGVQRSPEDENQFPGPLTFFFFTAPNVPTGRGATGGGKTAAERGQQRPGRRAFPPGSVRARFGLWGPPPLVSGHPIPTPNPSHPLHSCRSYKTFQCFCRINYLV